MKTNLLLTGLVVLVSLMATASFSAPSSIGPTGILNVPTAEAVTAGRFEALLAYDSLDVSAVRVHVLPIATLGYGFANGEIGVSYFNVKDYTEVKSANAKYIFAHERGQSPSIAAGVIYLSGNTAETDLYLTATHSFGTGGQIKGTAGLLYQKPNNAPSDNLTGMMGLEFGEPGKTAVGLDYIFKDIAAGGIFGATLRQPITPEIALQVGMGSGDRFLIGMTMKFGGK